MKKGLNRKDIDAYMDSESTPFKQRIEESVLADPFERDALDGFQEMALNTSSLQKLDKKFRLRTELSLIFGSLTILLVGAAILFYIAQNNTPQTPTFSKQIQTIRIEKTEVFLPKHIDTLSELPLHKQIVVKELIKDFTEQKEQPAEQESKLIAPLEVHHLATNDDAAAIELQVEQKQINGKEIYLHDLKLLDYRAYRSKPQIKTEQLILTGIPAELESGNSKTESEWQTIDVPYIEFLERTMDFFAKGNFKKALNRFETILATYPDDINALFYSGLCYYNLKRSNEAAIAFGKCQQTGYSNFNEEIEWYYALSLIVLGETERAQTILKRIVSTKSFYAEQAKKKLNEL